MNYVTGVLIVSLVVNIFLSLFKIIMGIIFLSSSLIADGMHSFSDLITDIVGIIGAVFSKKPPDEKHPFGHGKIEYLISIFIGIVIIILSITIIFCSLKREVVVPNIIVILVSIIVIIIKFFLAHFLVRKGRELKSNILVSSGKESSTDVVSSIVVLVSSVLMQLNINFFKYSDIIASIIVGIFIFKVGFDILKENISNILGEVDTNLEYLQLLKDSLLKNFDIKKIDNIKVLKYGPYNKLILSVFVLPDMTVFDTNLLGKDVENFLKENFKKINYVCINFLPYL